MKMPKVSVVLVFAGLLLVNSSGKVLAATPTTSPAPSWPAGTNPPLVINAGQVVTIPCGSTQDFASITIKPGGILQISEGIKWTMIGCAGADGA
jgi:hypothetical protein